MGTLAEWILSFRALHERARRGQVRDAEASRYRAARDELARALQADLDLVTSRVRAVTIDLSTGGFSCLLPRAPGLGEDIGFTLRIPLTDPIAGRACVQDVKPMAGGHARVSFTSTTISDAARERVELFVFDTVLAQLTPGGV